MIGGLLRSLLPRRCPGCQGQLGGSAGLCPECLGELRPQLQRFSVLRAGSEPGLLVLGPYQGVLGRSVRALKYGGSRELAGVLGMRLAEGVPARWQVRAVCAVPLHAARLQQRGFNQAELLGRAVAARLGVPYLELLSRERATGRQATRRAEERRTSLAGAFRGRPLPMLGGAVLLLDDVTTSGATLLACAQALDEAGVGPVYFAAVAR